MPSRHVGPFGRHTEQPQPSYCRPRIRAVIRDMVGESCAFSCVFSPRTLLSSRQCLVQRTFSLKPGVGCHVKRARVHASASSDTDVEIGPTPLAPTVSDTWELDFYSRPVVGSDGKKLWELIIVDSLGVFEHVEIMPNSMVNSRELRKRIKAVMDESPKKPRVVRFFRSQMYNMINIALSDIDVEVRPSRRTYALYELLKERETSVYPKMPGYRGLPSTKQSSLEDMDLGITEKLPDELRCEKFVFGNIPLGQVEEFFATADSANYFGDSCIVDSRVSKDALVPGLIVISSRSKALAAWMSGVELAYIKAALKKREIVLECGLSTVYRFAAINDTIKEEARNFEVSKRNVEGLHFLAVQKTTDTDEIDGFWLFNDSLITK